ncbi:hypothetical protein K3718_10750 [Leisingera aquaemixtae]|uniref:Uncharacterized protein n=1 Tax=Leisingera aquaemixtae TaxID=1396826 RepID=A0ABY5WF08_9RHOB|nr:hypothetical protein [Leisingera aquaemixtae]UWQ40053.1 hypothetical protein K3718_10750 [Leisingera aquaemixtae]
MSARPELVAEFCEETGQKILIYTPNRFLQLAEEKLGVKLSDGTIDEIKQEHDARLIAQSEARQFRERVLRRRRMREKMADGHGYQSDQELNVADEFARLSRISEIKSELNSLMKYKFHLFEDLEFHRGPDGDSSILAKLMTERELLRVKESKLKSKLEELEGKVVLRG